MTVTTATTRRTLTLVAGTAAALALAAGLGACGSTGSADDASSASGKRPATTTSAPATESTVVVTGAGNSGSTGSSGNDQNGTSPMPGGPKPTIDSFTTPENIDCHNGNFQEFTASWTTTGAGEVTISIDGTGVYDTYAADGETSLPFNCSSSHTFVLTARSDDGQTATRTITLQPRNVQGQSGDDEDAMVRTTARVQGGSTGDGPASEHDCQALGTQLDSLQDMAMEALDANDLDTASANLDEADKIENQGYALGCFFVFT